VHGLRLEQVHEVTHLLAGQPEAELRPDARRPGVLLDGHGRVVLRLEVVVAVAEYGLGPVDQLEISLLA